MQVAQSSDSDSRLLQQNNALLKDLAQYKEEHLAMVLRRAFRRYILKKR